MSSEKPSSPSCFYSKGVRALLLAEAERFEGVPRGYEVVLLEHVLGRRLSEPSLELRRVHVEEQFDQVVVVDFSEDAAGDVHQSANSDFTARYASWKASVSSQVAVSMRFIDEVSPARSYQENWWPRSFR